MTMDRNSPPETPPRDKSPTVLSIDCLTGSSKAEEWTGDMLQTGDIVEEIVIGPSGSSSGRNSGSGQSFTAPFKNGKSGVQKILHSSYKNKETSILVRVRRDRDEFAELQACIVPESGFKNKYFLRSIEDPNYAVGFSDRSEAECFELQASRSSRIVGALSRAKLQDGYVAYAWGRKMQEALLVPNSSCFLSLLLLPKASDRVASRYNDLEDTLARANAWLNASQASGVPIVFMNIQTESLLTKKAIIKLNVEDGALRRKALKVPVGVSGVERFSFDGKEKILMVTGEFDVVHLLRKLRKVCPVELVSVGTVNEHKSDEAETNKAEKQKEKKKGAQLDMSEGASETGLGKSKIVLTEEDPQSKTSFNVKDAMTSIKTKTQNLWKVFDRTTKEPNYAHLMEEYVAEKGKSLEKKSQEIESDSTKVGYLTSDVEDDSPKAGYGTPDVEEIIFDTLVRTRSFVMLAQSHPLLEPTDRQSPLLITEDDITHLKVIHQSLNDTARECLINFALMCQNQEIETDKLVSGWLLNDLIHSQLEAKDILGTLFSFNLLQSKEDGQFVKLPEVYQYIILDHIIPKNRLFLMQGGKGLTKPPEVEEWEKSKQIYLMDNELSELPENLRCPMLEALFLQRNYKLRVIPPTFFDNMPALQVLNLARTRIKVLPESLFKLVNLKRLFLNHCDLLITLSNKIGELKCLEVLDLEGTEIMYLPVEVEQLTNLKCLKVSFCEPMNNGRTDRSKQSHDVIPWVIISNLSQLNELNIDVSPDDHRWNENVEDVVPEVCGLAKLHTLKFYFPRVELLSNFKWYGAEWESPSLVHFKFIVGHHVKRIISRIPHDAEFELERYDKCLRWVNGVGVHMEIEKVLGHANAFFLDRHTGIKKLSEFGFENMVHLECCIVGECNELEAIHDGYQVETGSSEVLVGFPSLKYLCIYYMKNLRSIWEGQLQPTHIGLSFLKYLILRTCPQLTTIFTLGLLANLCNLEEMTVDDCPAIISLVSCDDHDNITVDFLPNLKKISLHYLPELVSIFNGLHISPTVEQMSIYYCPTLKSLHINKYLNENLKEIKGETCWWKGLKWEGTEELYWDDKFVPIDACD